MLKTCCAVLAVIGGGVAAALSASEPAAPPGSVQPPVPVQQEVPFGADRTATPGCGMRAALAAQLATEWAERPAALGLGDDGAAVELLLSANGATWSLLRVWPDGSACLIGAGESWLIWTRPVGTPS